MFNNFLMFVTIFDNFKFYNILNLKSDDTYKKPLHKYQIWIFAWIYIYIYIYILYIYIYIYFLYRYAYPHYNISGLSTCQNIKQPKCNNRHVAYIYFLYSYLFRYIYLAILIQTYIDFFICRFYIYISFSFFYII